MSDDCAIQHSATGGNWSISITVLAPNDKPLGSKHEDRSLDEGTKVNEGVKDGGW
jgi:hypothetical protein